VTTQYFLFTYYLLTYLLKSKPTTRFHQPGTRFQNRFLRQITNSGKYFSYAIFPYCYFQTRFSIHLHMALVTISRWCVERSQTLFCWIFDF